MRVSDKGLAVLRSRITQRATETFGSPVKASRWLHRPTRPLGTASPLEMLATREGAVEALLARVDHSLAS
ncbi:antitoxin Xre/MbcA/ParS toxin-binding domain-containing protein [Sabulicella rubraurantiaca]|uniref:antitoxin Xre/MbcA/ParS toxin-binding domain-containing protein n=1 Tax=Sabulicella rubraurantiaca TaxID=2811429 RepID=UPI001A974429